MRDSDAKVDPIPACTLLQPYMPNKLVAEERAMMKNQAKQFIKDEAKRKKQAVKDEAKRVEQVQENARNELDKVL